MRWDAARAASQRPARKYKPVAPVGPCLLLLCPDIKMSATMCHVCGYHVCSCPKLEPCGLNTVTMENPHYMKPGDSYAFALNPQREARVAAKRFELPPLPADTYDAFKSFVPYDAYPEELL